MSRREAITRPAGSSAKPARASAASAATIDSSPSGDRATHRSRSIGCMRSDRTARLRHYAPRR